MTNGLTLSATGAAELGSTDRDELIRKIRELVQDVEDLYRPTRAIMPSARVTTDPVMLGLYGARDALIAAENAILGIALQRGRVGTAGNAKAVGVDISDVLPS